MSELSPAALAVANAYTSTPIKSGIKSPLAAALRAVVNEVAPEKTIEDIDYVHQSYVDGYKDALYEILIIVNELEAQ